MSIFVEEIMNRELFSVGPEEKADDVLSYVLSLGVSGTPVLDAEGAPVGMISLRDLVGHPGELVGQRMARPAACVGLRSSIEAAARLMGETGFHRLVVVDDDGHAVGIISTMDVLSSMTGVPVRHPSAFPHYDPETGASWSDPHVLDFDRVEAAPAAAGLIVIEHNAPGEASRAVWAEAALDMRTRLIDTLSEPHRQPPILSHWLREGHLEFRTAEIPSTDARNQALGQVRDRLGPFGGSSSPN